MQPYYRLVLGTAQLGIPYGIANKSGQPDHKTSLSIVRAAWDRGIRIFDTAHAYGESETVLGACLSKLGLSQQAQIITKLPINIDHLNPQAVKQALEKSLELLKVPFLYGLMLHRETLLDDWDKGLTDILGNFVREGRVQKLGVSVYSPSYAAKAVKTEGIGIIQIPTNILDQRFYRAGIFELAEECKKKIFIRSAFLQGLILMKSHELPENMLYAKPILDKMNHLSQQFSLSKQEIAMIYLREKYINAKIIFGAETLTQVIDNLHCWGKNMPVGFMSEIDKTFKNIDEKIIDPILWPQ
jgi:aryl-alcohol dehydrogenase-like predicted oxidoreductase